MSWTARLHSLAIGAFRRARMEREMDTEMHFHLAAYTDDLIRSGVPREEAERRARIEFGHFEPLKEDCRQARGLRILDEIAQDLHYAARMVRHNPGFALIAIFTLALGIGANTSIFSVVNAWILKPLPFENPDRLVSIFSLDKKHNLLSEVSPADLHDWRRTDGAFEDISGLTTPFFTLQQGGQPQQLAGGRVNWQFFHMLRVSPVIGRDFIAEDDRPGATPVALLSYELWKSDFAGDPALVGRTIPLDGANVTVIGILPARFHLPLAGPVRVWMPLALTDEALNNRRAMYMDVIARIKPGFNLTTASSFLQTLALRLEHSHPESNTGRGVRVMTLADAIGRQGGNDRALVLFALVGCVLLMACTNVANLILSRAVGRQKEMAVRLAMGAGRGRVLRQLLVENLLLFLLAAALSVVFAIGGVHWIAQSIPVSFRAYLPDEARLHVDPSTLLYTLAVGLCTGLLFGFGPAFRSGRTDVVHALKESTSRTSSSSGAARLKSCLVTLEVSLALVVLVASGLLVKGLLRMYSTDAGFNPNGLVTARITLSDTKYSDLKRARAFYDDLLNRIRSFPAVKSAAAGQFLPYSGNNGHVSFVIDGRPAPAPGELTYVSLNRITPDYFKTLGQALLRGRPFLDTDGPDAPQVIVINQTFAQKYWNGQNPIGVRVRYGLNLARRATIIGVVKDTNGFDDSGDRAPMAFVPQAQLPSRDLMLVIRTAAGSPDISQEIRRAVVTVDKGQPVSDVRTMEELMAERQAPFLIVGQVTMFFSGLSLFLAALGIYGVVAYTVAARKQEFGIRMALGAARRDLLRLVIGQGMKLTLFGLVIGLLGALAVTRLMSSILYQISPTDLSTFLSISALLLIIAFLASYLPARRASRVDPTRMLRYE